MVRETEMRFTTGNPEAHDYLEGIEKDDRSLFRNMDGAELEQHYEMLMRNASHDDRGVVETANYKPQDAFTFERRRVFAELCRRGLRSWNVRV